MKKFLLAALAASALTASPAFAAPNFSGNSNGIYALSANNTTFCRFGLDNVGVSGTNSTVTAEANDVGGASGLEGDGTFKFAIQNDSFNTVKAASGTYDVNNAVCNTGFTIIADSQNGGLRSVNTTSDTNDFIMDVDYNISVNFDGKTGSRDALPAGQTTLVTSTEARFGKFTFTIAIPAVDKQLLQGAYKDRLVMTVQPNAAGGSTAS